MILAVTQLVMRLVLLHSLDGHEVSINPAQVTNLVAQLAGTKNPMVSDAIRCKVELSNGKFIGVVEDCATVKQLLENAR